MSADDIDPKLVVVVDPEIMGGAPVFRGTRVPIDTLFENLADGMSLDQIIEEWPSLDQDDVEALLRGVPASLTTLKAA